MVNMKVENWKQCLSTLGAGHFTFPTRLQLARGEQAGGRQVQRHRFPCLSRQCGHRCHLLFQQSWSCWSNIAGQVQLCDSDCRPWRPHTDGPPATGTTASQGNVSGNKFWRIFPWPPFWGQQQNKKTSPSELLQVVSLRTSSNLGWSDVCFEIPAKVEVEAPEASKQTSLKSVFIHCLSIYLVIWRTTTYIFLNLPLP